MLKCVRQILVTLTVHTSLLKSLHFKYLIEQKGSIILTNFVVNNNYIEKFDAYRLKLKEIKLLRIKILLKTPYFKGFL